MSWELKEGLQKILAKEQGHCIFPAGMRSKFALVYPNSYFVGMSNLGMHILYQQMNGRKDTACERFFLPDKQDEKEYQRTNTPLMSLETQTPLYQFPLIGFAVSFEMDYFNLLKVLELGKVELLAAKRKETDPIVIAGGPCATFNPEPLSDFVDAFIIGEGEETIQAFLNAYYAALTEDADREQILLRLAAVPGVYVPKFYTHIYNADGTIQAIEHDARVPAKVERQWVRDLDAYAAHTVIATESTEFNLFLIEIARGCGRHCRFCMAGYCFRQPRNRSLAKLEEMLQLAKKYGKKVGLMGAAISDYPEINVLCHKILAMDLPMSVASFRADSVTGDLVDSLAHSGLKTLTMAPEAGSEKIRKVINKGIEKEHLFHAIDLGIGAGIKNFRLYIMIGLPFEEAEDIEAIIEMTHEIKDYMEKLGNKGVLTLSINPFVPKPLTPFQWLPMGELKQTEHNLKYIKAAFKQRKNVDVLIESPKEAYVQGILARGDRRISQVIYSAHALGGSKGFKKAMKQHNLADDFYLYRRREAAEIFPWETLAMGFTREYLYRELELAAAQQATAKCFAGCKRCGVCTDEEAGQ